MQNPTTASISASHTLALIPPTSEDFTISSIPYTLSFAASIHLYHLSGSPEQLLSPVPCDVDKRVSCTRLCLEVLDWWASLVGSGYGNQPRLKLWSKH